MPNLVVQMEENTLSAAYCGGTSSARGEEKTRARRYAMAGFEGVVKAGHDLMVEEVVSAEEVVKASVRRGSVHEWSREANTK